MAMTATATAGFHTIDDHDEYNFFNAGDTLTGPLAFEAEAAGHAAWSIEPTPEETAANEGNPVRDFYLISP
jgi:hypothetical protein